MNTKVKRVLRFMLLVLLVVGYIVWLPVILVHRLVATAGTWRDS